MKFDWVTFSFQIVNVLLLLAILRHFLFRPVADIISRRQSETDAALNAAEEARTKAEAATAKAEAEAEATAAARKDVLAKAQAEAEEQHKLLIDKAHDEAAKIIADCKATMEHRADETKVRELARARDLAVSIAERALADQPADMTGYIERLVAALNKLSPEERGALLHSGHLKVVSPAPLPDAEKSAVQTALTPFDIKPDFTSDPVLIAGLELHSDGGVIRNSLAHDIDQLAEAMRDDRPD